ncbi:hypothetical protein [Amphritea pacifica]|uniref:hypothetical protein n=1 Tax=Amphritea pacifica TaxID=2811233 RepID=UPI00196521A0|nr:hypothetical protein [Amphritea pacifica]MBN1007186.1 hypothetical protein [Amphritea pacifica]
MLQDDGIRAKNGVAACLREVEGGKLRLIFDDIQTDAPRHPVDWRTVMLFTFNDYDKGQMSTLNLSKEDYAMIGENLVIRLLAMEGKLSEI